MRHLWIALVFLLLHTQAWAKDKWVFQSSYLLDFDVISNDEIVYVKSSHYRIKGYNEDGDPTLTTVQIRKRMTDGSKGDEILLEIAYRQFYSRRDYQHHRVYEDSRFFGTSGIDGIDYCPATGFIIFSSIGNDYYVRPQKARDGIFVMDLRGRIQREILIRACRGQWNLEGNKFIFQTHSFHEAGQTTGHTAGVFIYDMQENAYRFITEHAHEVLWTPDGQGIFAGVKTIEGGRTRFVPHRISLDGTRMERANALEPCFCTPNQASCATPSGLVYERSPKGDRKHRFIELLRLKAWFPDGRSLLGQRRNGDIVIVDAQDYSMRTLVQNYDPFNIRNEEDNEKIIRR